MWLSRSLKVVLDLLTALPILYVILFAALIVRMLVWRTGGDPRADIIPLPMADLWVHLAMMFLIAFLIAFYLVYLFKIDRVPPDQRAPWAVALLVVNTGAMPLFFGRHVRPERSERRR